MKLFSLPATLAVFAASALPAFALADTSVNTFAPCGFSRFSGMMGWMGGYGGWFFLPVFGWLWMIVWTVNSILLGFLLWAWFKKMAK